MEKYLFTIALLILILVMAAWLLIYIKRDKIASPIDLITGPDGRLSAAKIGVLVGMVVSSFVVIKLSATGQLNYDIFLIYLSFIATVDGFTKFLRAKIIGFKEPSKEPKLKATKISNVENIENIENAILPAPPRENREIE